MDALTRLERPAGPDWLRGLCIAMFVAPPLLAVVVARVVNGLDAPSGRGNFEPANAVVLGCIVTAASYAAVFVALVDRIRRRSDSRFFGGLRGGAMTVARVWQLGLLLWAMTAISGTFFVCASINRAIGRVAVESWRVWDKETRTGKGCHLRLAVMSRVSLESARVCVTRERWEQARVDDSIAMMAITSPLGVQRGALPPTTPVGKEHAP